MELGVKRYPGLDHLRTLAILLVFFFHYRLPFFEHPQWVTDYFKFAWTGVDLFFVLSGFLISSQLFSEIKTRQDFSYREFILKRFFRIIPVYLVVVLVYFSVPVFHEREALPELWRFLTFSQNFGLDISQFGTFSHAWSLCVEEHFYFLLPLILMLLLNLCGFKNCWWILPLLFCAGILIRHYGWTEVYAKASEDPHAGAIWYRFIYYPTYCRLDGLLVGVGLAALSQFKPKFWVYLISRAWVSFLISLIVLSTAYYICEDEHGYQASVFGFPLVALGYGFLLIAAVSPTTFLSKPARWSSFIAGISYSMYLIHKGITHMVQEWFSDYGVDESSNLMLLISFAMCVLYAYALYVFVEKPFLVLRNKVLKRKITSAS